MAFDIDNVAVAPLNGAHRLDAFACRNPNIQAFCRGDLEQAHEARCVRAFVATHAGDPRIVGFYTLTLSTITHDEVGREAEDRFLHVEAIPTVYLGTLGVDRRVERRGVGKLLMRDALVRFTQIAEHAGTYALTLDALDDEAATYYESNFDFQRFSPPHGRKMFLLAETILDLPL